MGLVNVLSSFVCQTSYDDLPPAVVSAAKLRIFDYMGGAMGELLEYGGNNKSAAIDETKLPCIFNDMADGHRFSGSHPATITVPAALRMAEAKAKTGGISGKDFILAVTLGYEVMLRIGRAINPSAVERGFHITTVVGPFGSTTVAGKLIGLDEAGMADALSISAITGAGLLAAVKAPKPMVDTQVGRACQAGIFCALRAQSGVKGYDMILEDGFLKAFSDEYNLDGITKDLGKEYMVTQSYLKVYGGCRHYTPPIDATLHIMKGKSISPTDIEQIRVKVYAVALSPNLHIEKPKTCTDAKFNAHYNIAMALVYDHCSVDKYTEENIKDERVQKLVRQITVEHDPELDKGYPEKRGAKVEITTKQGEQFSHSVDLAKGEPEFPYSKTELEDKFRYETHDLISENTKQSVIDFVDELETVEDVSSLFTLMKTK
ncbi:MmgE/PrpD family protein [Chloroflexota bacterium]